jgi:hypothetical protein
VNDLTHLNRVAGLSRRLTDSAVVLLATLAPVLASGTLVGGAAAFASYIVT